MASPGPSQELLAQAIALENAGRHGAAAAMYDRLLATTPGHAGLLHRRAGVALMLGDPEDAAHRFGALVEANPSDLRARVGLSEAARRRGDAAAAKDHLHVAADMAQSTDDWRLVGDGFRRLGIQRRAGEAYEKALAQDPANLTTLNNLAVTRLAEDRLAEAEALYRRAVDATPDGDPSAARTRYALASLLELLNRPDEAHALSLPLMAEYPEDAAVLTLQGRLMRRAGDLAGAEAAVRRALAAEGPTAVGPVGAEEVLHAAALFDLGHILDRQDRPTEAIEAFDEANAMQRRADGARHDPARFLAYIGRCRTWFDAPRISGFDRFHIDLDARERPIFFVGFPRSGTTLAEQILAAHPALVTTGEQSPLEAVKADWAALTGLAGPLPECLAEITPQAVAACRARFFAAAQAVTGEPTRRVVDKLPLNLVDLGLVNLLFPDARIVVALRDPRDVVLSCFMQNFRLNDAMAAFLALDETVNLYARAMDLWLHYRAVLSLPWMEYRYEDLVEDVEGVARRLVDFIGEPWTPAVLDYRAQVAGRSISTPSYAAVSAPVHRDAAGRWRRYGDWLAPQQAALAPYVAAFGYPNA